jgi:uncharacterized repeat protein (TIGR03837 family)
MGSDPKRGDWGLTPEPERWDIFCRVVDNYGDAGVSWRLARSLAREHGKAVRLWVDDPAVLARLRPEVDPAKAEQVLEGVQICRMREPFAPGDVADVVVETFGCDPPDSYARAMVGRQPEARWINLEYLSAEEWVERSHALPSPNPRLPLTKHYFFPGFTARTGGVLREADLIARRDAFQQDPGIQAAFWNSLVGAVPPGGALKLSLFAYERAPVAALVEACARLPVPVWIIAPEGFAADALEAHEAHRDGEGCGHVEAFVVPFLPQDRYDELLWACDVNFVRGEDSFVRAQWAARPFAWHIYPQEEGAHWVKLSAFLDRYAQGLDRAGAAAIRALWKAWNEGGEVPDADADLDGAWQDFIGRRGAMADHARAWSRSLEAQPELAATLVKFAAYLVK